jgi:SPP1 gp7 family putative phage head morphogenesis protein
MPEPTPTIGGPTIGRIYRTALKQRAALLRGERQAAGELVRAYGGVWERIRGRIEALLAEREAALARGERVTAAWLWQYERMTTLERQVEQEMWGFARTAGVTIAEQQRAAVALAEEHVFEQVAGGLVQLNRLPTEAVVDLVGFTGDGSPLRELLDALGPQASAHVRDALIQGVALGKNPRAIARETRSAFGRTLSRALTVSRTETLRAYREATRRNYQENSDVVRGWIWVCACTPRSCAACFAMHGTVHGANERLDGHPNCRCVMAPYTYAVAGMAEQELPDAGPEVFAKLSEEDQVRVLGPAAAAAYRAGAVRLEDFVGRRRSRDWGSTRYAKSLGAVVGPEQAREWTAKALGR